uniref:IgGFc-binding protein N-terminal domain-containing protein n=1 Tax=Latimeria chalumnae TaxID=7897 RepID=H2ZUV5_LATCH
CPLGMEFVTILMENRSNNNTSGNRSSITISALYTSTYVSVFIFNTSFHEHFILAANKTVLVSIENPAELGSNSKTVIIRANSSIAVMSFTLNPDSTEPTIVYPVTYFGTEYYILTPKSRHQQSFTKFTVINFGYMNLINVNISGSIFYNCTFYPAGSKLTFTLLEYETIQIESDEDLTGSHIVSQYPVAVLSKTAATCFAGNTQVFEQLSPVCKWGTSFIVLPFSDQNSSDLVYVVASQDTNLQVQAGLTPKIISLSGGETKELSLENSAPLVINATAGIMVMLYHERKTNSTLTKSTLMNVIPTEKFSSSYISISYPNFESHIVLITNSSETSGVMVDKKTLSPNKTWRAIPGTEFSWTNFNITFGNGFHMVTHSSSLLGVYEYGIASFHSWSSTETCLD